MSLITLPAFLTRRREDSTMTDASTAEAPTATGDNILMRFLTQGGATVIVTGSGRYGAEDCRWNCLGCDDGSPDHITAYDWSARGNANEHAAECRSMPKPEA